MVQTRSRAQHQPLIDATSSNHSLQSTSITSELSSEQQHPTAEGKSCRKRSHKVCTVCKDCSLTAAAAHGDDGLQSVKKARRTRSVSRVRVIQQHHEVCGDDLNEDTEHSSPSAKKARRTRSVSKARTIYPAAVYGIPRSVAPPSINGCVSDLNDDTDDDIPSTATTKKSRRTKSVSRARVIQHSEVCGDGTDKPMHMRTRSVSRARNVQHEIFKDDLNDDIDQSTSTESHQSQATAAIILQGNTSRMTTPENVHTTDEILEAVIQHSSTTLQHHHHSSFTSSSRHRLTTWSHQYYDWESSNHSPDYPLQHIDNPMILRSDRLYEDGELKRIYEDEESNESILPRSLESSQASAGSYMHESSGSDEEEKKGKKNFFGRYCSVI